jgi:flagellar export protein FliJ
MTKRFRFRLEAVEKVRRAKEQEALRGLAAAQAKYQDALRAKRKIYDDNELALIRREELARTAQPVLAYQLENEFITGNAVRFVQADQAIFRARKFVEKALREVMTAKRAVRAIELLREKAYSEFKTALRKREQKEMEEVYVSRAHKREGDEAEWSESA